MRHVLDGGVVGDECGGGAQLPVDLRQRFQHADAGLAVERAGRLVAQQDVGALGDGARDGHALLLATRHLRGEVIHALAEPDQIQRVFGGHRIARDLRHEVDVLARGERRDEVVELEDEADVVAPVGGEAGVIQAASGPDCRSARGPSWRGRGRRGC